MRNPIVQTAFVVAVVLLGLLVSRAAVATSTSSAQPKPQVVTSPGGPLSGPGLVVSGVELDVDQCVVIEAGSSVVARAGSENSSVWVYADAGDVVRVDYDSASISESTVIPERDLAYDFAPGRVTVIVRGSDETATVSFVALSADTSVCGLKLDEG